MTDQFGNYLCQKIMEVASDEYLKAVVDNILDSISQVVINVHGTRSVQALIETLNKKLSVFEGEIMRIINQLNKEIKDLILNVHANHVI